MNKQKWIINKTDPVLITGATGFIGSRVLETLLRYGFMNIRCLVRRSSDLLAIQKILGSYDAAAVQLVEGTLLRMDECRKAAEGVSVIYHLAAGRGEKSYANAYLNSAVTTRNILESIVSNKSFKRFLNVSSFSVYATQKIRGRGLLDEDCPMEKDPEQRGEAYCYGKVKQDEMVFEYAKKHHVPYVIVRPGVVYGPGNKGLTGRVGIGTFGIFLHLGGSNSIPLSYVDNCAEAIVLSGLVEGINAGIFNIVDDELPTSRRLLKLYKNNVYCFRSIYLPHFVSYSLCYLWEKYSEWSKGQLPPAFTRNRWAAYWKGNRYSNHKLHNFVGWKPNVNLDEGLRLYFEYQKTLRRS